MSEEKFEYTYSALTEKERNEAEFIRNQYLPKKEEDNKFKRLRALDAKVKNVPTCIALIFGVIGTLVFGTGLAMVLEWNLLLWGIVVCAVGGTVALLAYPMNQVVSKRMHDKYSGEILKLSEEILSEK